MIANTSSKKLKDFLILVPLLHDRRGQVPVFPQFPFFEWLEYLGQYLSGTSDFVKRGHICNRTQNTVLNCWQSPWQNCGQCKLMCFPNTPWSLLKGEEGLRRVQKKADWTQLSCFGKEGRSIAAWIQGTRCYLPSLPAMKMQVGAYTGQLDRFLAKWPRFIIEGMWFLLLCGLWYI